MKSAALAVSICLFVGALLAASGCSSERDRRSRVDVLHSEDWYEDDAVQRGVPGEPRDPSDGRGVQPIVETREAEQDSIESSPEEGSPGDE